MLKNLKPKFSLGLWAFGSSPDRFVPTGYHEDIPPAKQLEIAEKVEDLDGLEFFYPWSFKGVGKEGIREWLETNKKGCSSVGAALFDDRKWQDGSLASSDKNIRQEAIEITKEAMDIAEYLNCKNVNMWLGQEGFDYPFEINYEEYFDRLVEGLQICADHNPKVNLVLEYKIKEPKNHETISNAGIAILIANEVNRPNIGINIDTGHSFNCQENLAEAVFYCNRYSKLLHVHIDDNYGTWDNDLVVGSIHYWEFVEFFYMLDKIGYGGWLGLDLHPFRLPVKEAYELSVRNIKRMLNLLDKVDNNKIDEALLNQDYIAVMKAFEKIL